MFTERLATEIPFLRSCNVTRLKDCLGASVEVHDWSCDVVLLAADSQLVLRRRRGQGTMLILREQRMEPVAVNLSQPNVERLIQALQATQKPKAKAASA